MITDLSSLQQFFRKNIKTPVWGVGVYAFDRLGLEDIVPNYRLLALRYSLDTKLIEKDVEVFSLEKDMGLRHINAPRNSTTVLGHPRVKKYLSKFNNPALIVYKTSFKMERICRENNWRLVGAPAKFGKKLLEDKVKFRKILLEINVPPPPGEIVPAKNLLINSKTDFFYFQNKYGSPIVLQHPRRGGGKGTFFIHSEDEWQTALRKLRIYEKEGAEIEEDINELEVIIAQYIKGPSPSITGCVTRHGILSTSPQYQLIDIPELYNPGKGSGLFCGHDWTSSRFAENILQQAYDIVEKVGLYFKTIGYKGIFGIDFVLDEETQKLFVTECNPRLLGSFPVTTMAQIRNNEPPILAFHLLEFLDADYLIDVREINALMRQPKFGAQMFPHNLTGRWARSNASVRPGIYKLKSKVKSQKSKVWYPPRADELDYIRPGYALKHLQYEDELLLTDGVLPKKAHYSPNRRLGRILALSNVLAPNKKGLTPWASQVALGTHSAFKLRRVWFAKLRKFFNPDFLAKG